jgi:hypothetical protein
MITIVGAGMAGLLAANMLQRHDPLVLEKANGLPNNHSAVLRFRSRAVGDLLGIPFKRVEIIKTVIPWTNPVADALAYSRKNTGVMRSDRSITNGPATGERYIAPSNLIEQMAARVRSISYGVDWSPELTIKPGDPVISTMPMPMLMDLLGYNPKCDINWAPAINIRARVHNCDAYASIMVPDPTLGFSRISLTGDELIIECPGLIRMSDEAALGVAKYACHYMGISPDDLTNVEAHASRYAKILPMDEDERKDFIYIASAEHNIYSLGRFATWRPGLLLDDLVQDVRKIEGWLGGSRYAMAKDAK